ncbi:MAG: hypothetical protein JNL80_08185 [Phycisphaerae bacterium]|jgi:hypothetical protein|nr:hypothetical protein [Phycisphaerae bacterium]
MLVTLALGGLTIGLGACTGHLNQSDGLLGTQLTDLEGRIPGAIPANETPSLHGLDRSAWERTTVRVERRQVESLPSYTSRVLYDHSTARERGERPTITSVLEGDGSGYRASAEAFSSPVFAALDLLMMPVRLVTSPPLRIERAPVSLPALSTPARSVDACHHAAPTEQPGTADAAPRAETAGS